MIRSALAAVLLASCIGPAADHERLGDGAYVQGDWVVALREYEAAGRNPRDPRVYAKLGLAAYHARQYAQAVEAYRRLAEADPTRKVEAARGLERVAQAAERDDVPVALEQAVRALRVLHPERVNPRHTLSLFRSGRLPDADAVGLGPLALAAAGDAATTDQILVQYGDLLRETLACEDAAAAYLAALRRTRDPTLRRRAAQGFGVCGFQLGQEALALQKPELAARWFGRVVSADSLSDVGRRALVGLGDARIALGDILGAALAFQDAARQGEAPDSITVLARQRLAGLGGAAVADSPWVRP
ncbi:MAG TPA: tetratricopeptide repeat protein [Gemmatimonadales bacterium]|nr:tetratricopeptide repeat protein [Gemmatimonadales bacterium]